MPAQVHPALQTSLVVQALPSLQGVPGRALPPMAPRQSIGWPTHWQLPFHVSFPVAEFPSLHAVPGSAGPPTTPRQSVTTPLIAIWPWMPWLKL